MLRLLPLVMLGACSIGAQNVPFPDANELIATIEARTVMPPGAGPLAGYSRTYSRRPMGPPPYQDGFVYGVLERVTDAPRTARWAEGALTAPDDGGCDVVNLRYNLALARIDEIACNGVA